MLGAFLLWVVCLGFLGFVISCRCCNMVLAGFGWLPMVLVCGCKSWVLGFGADFVVVLLLWGVGLSGLWFCWLWVLQVVVVLCWLVGL